MIEEEGEVEEMRRVSGVKVEEMKEGEMKGGEIRGNLEARWSGRSERKRERMEKGKVKGEGVEEVKGNKGRRSREIEGRASRGNSEILRGS